MLDLIIKLDNECRIKALQQVGRHPVLLADTQLIGREIDHVLGAPLKEYGMVELDNNFYRYQCAAEAGEKVLYVSSDGVLLEFYQQISRLMSEGVQVYDRNGYFLFANPASEMLEGYDSREYQGKHLLDIYDVNEEYSTVLTILRTKKPVANRCDRFKMKNGTTLTTINSGYPLIIDNYLYGAVVFESDLSVLKRLEKRTFNLEAYIGSTGPDGQAAMYTFDDIVHEAESMRELIHFAKKVSLTDSAILIVGATGTGKELVAQGIHSFSPRRYKPFIDINCSAVPGNLFESIFFGTEKGAFTGSVSKPGLFETANGGTIFLDEVNSISPEIQVKLLRVLQEKRFQRIGGSKYIQCDVRIISAANEDLNVLIKQQKIRMDFYYRISAIKMDLPDLKDRSQDSLLLARHFLDELCKQYHREQVTIAQEVLAVFEQYEWPGNVRELHHVIEYAFNRAADDASILTLDCLPGYLRALENEGCAAPQCQDLKGYATEGSGTFDERMERFEYELIRQTLTANGGNITHSARQLGISRQSLQYRMKKLNIYDW
ncbi:Sigma54 specific transcriptional regulator, Fis family [uncultured Sporomusa sp.]|uniref:Sigma54 specific transcriptional regulator, Fis family n=1 Tax=uncultured Sporomusa sp. TaxID=307249 RepID=A0A212LUK1_9FIRM|nr:sigma 54-interacting transcriptional regulator [uncultured Sporomusa sp.]SCM81171.1 Sigma54 specific transcriptional regulator, Fis family [uncultured Sporomusa sp.]